MSSSSSNGGDTETPKWLYDVFLSFRGEDTRKGFVDHLYATLHEKGIHTFRDDDELKRGKSISPELDNAIKGSKFVVVIFSPNYANSSWCLGELVKAVEYAEEQKPAKKLLPVFYGVRPSDVRKQRGTYKEAFDKHIRAMFPEEEIEKWRKALFTVANTSGFDVNNMEHGHESRCIREIAVRILNQLGSRFSVSADTIGIEPQVENVMSLLTTGPEDDVRIIGIWGMGGIGKSTIARAVFNQICQSFEGSCYLDSVREVSAKTGLDSLQEKLLSETLKEGREKLHTGIDLLMARLSHKKVLIVLDDVDKDEQLEKLAPDYNRFGKGSRIIITTRNSQLLSAHGINPIYDVNLLGAETASKLFNKFAFKDGSPTEEFKEVSLQVVNYAGGLPLAIKVLGSFLHGREKNEWESELERLKAIPPNDIIGKLKLNFDALHDLEKEIFLDIACFYKGKRTQDVWRNSNSNMPLPPPPQPLVPRVLVLSSGESGGSEGDIVEVEESSSGASDPDYRTENARAVLAAYRGQNSNWPRRGEPSRSRIPRVAPRSSPPGQAPVPRSRHSSASTTADNPAPGFATSALGFATPMGSTFAMPSPSWPVSIPPSVSLLQGDVLAEDVMRSLVSTRDKESCRGRPDYRSLMETVIRYGAMGDALEVEAKARQELEAQMGSLNLQCEQLSFQREQMALRERRALEGQRAAEERSAMAVTRYRESSAFPVDVRAYISEHVEESYEALKATRAGSRYVAMEAAHMADIGEYDMQHKIYTQLRCRDPSFDPEAWGLLRNRCFSWRIRDWSCPW